MRTIQPLIVLTMMMLAGTGCMTERSLNLYVSIEGDDSGPGTSSAPFKTIARAQQAVRAHVREGLDRDVVVMIGGGTYQLDGPLVFGPDDGGTETHAVVYAAWPDEEPILSGGQPITGFAPIGKNEWVVELADVKSGSRWFRQLFRDGERLTRARFPNAPDVLRITETSEDVTRIAFDQSVLGYDSLGSDAELVVLEDWCIARARVASAEDKAITATHPVGWIGHGADLGASWTTASPGKAAYLESARAFLDQPDEWYLDRSTGQLIYRSDDDPNAHSFVAPRLQKLVIIQGVRDKPVRNLHFQGLTFAHSEWPLPSFGYIGTQAGHYGTNIKERIYALPAAVELTYTENCRLEKCRVLHTGASGIGLGVGCRKVRINRCEIADIAGNGIMVGLRSDEEFAGKDGGALVAEWADPQGTPRDNAITNCTLRQAGQVFSGSVGIYDAYCENTSITHNLVHDMPYTGISIGLKWDEDPSSQKGTRVEYNHVHDVMKLLADGGAIYTLGYQPGTIIRGNLLHDVHRSPYTVGAPNNGIFVDLGSKGYHFEDNIIYNTSAEPIRFNQVKRESHTWKNNSLGITPDAIDFPRENAAKAGPLSAE